MRTISSIRPIVAFVLVVVTLTGVVGHHFYNEPKLVVGTLAPQTIYAPTNANVEDTQTTNFRREAARRRAMPVLMIDEAANQRMIHNLEQQLQQGQALRQRAGSIPFVKTSILATSTQLYLRRAPEAEWQDILAAVSLQEQGASNSLASLDAQRALLELRAYRADNPQAMPQLLATITQARKQYQNTLAQLAQLPPYDASVLSLSDRDWRNTQQEILQAAKRMLAQGIPAGLPAAVLKDAVTLNVSVVSPSIKPLAMQLLLSVLQPNLVVDPQATHQQSEQAALKAQAAFLKVQSGDLIVKSGQPISHSAFILLDHFELTRRQINWLELVATGALVSAALGVFWFVKTRIKALLSQRDLILLVLLSMTVLLSTWTAGAEYNSLPAVGLLIGSFYGSTLGATVVGLLAVLTALETSFDWLELLPTVASSLVGVLMAGKLRSREELALLGGGVALVQGLTYLILNSATGLIWYSLLGVAAWHGLLGLSWSIVALGISPYLEHLFDLVTPIRLAELANHNRPMLKRLALEAPGTFQHTLLVATLAEAAARSLNCNVELVRAGTLYHDIGKLHDPQSFIENQMGGPNKHDTINDPWKSAEVIKKHVTEGLVLARKCRLPKAVQAFIPEHQGTLLIAYFYDQAQKLGVGPVQESDFRYAGPVPQSRETGIVMLADACEASLRSVKDVSPEIALSTIKKIFKARWQDQQLVDSGLTRAEVFQIADIFVQVWQQFNHQRIRYPSSAQPASQSA